MGFKMRINFVDVICDNSLKSIVLEGKPIGYAFDIRLSYYRGLFLSCIEEFELMVDQEKVRHQDMTFHLNGKIFAIDQLADCASEFWNLIEPARIEVICPGGLQPGEHELDLTLNLRIPYMALPKDAGDHKYMPLDSCGKKTLTLRSEVGI